MTDLLTVAVVGLYCIGMIGIGTYASRRIRNTEDYLVAGRSLGFWVFVLLMVGSVCSGMSLLGVSGLGYAFGWPTIWEQIFVPLSIAFCVIFFAVKLRRVSEKTGYVTVQDYLAHRYNSHRAMRTLSAVAGIIVSLIYLIGQYTAIAIVLMWLFSIPLWLALIIATIVVTIYTTIGGLYAVAWAGIIQAIILIGGVAIMAPVVIFHAGGFTHINEVMTSINPNLVSPWMSEGMMFTQSYLVSFGLLLIVGMACAPHVINNVLAVKNSRMFAWAPLAGFLIYGAVMFLLKIAGFAGLVMVNQGVFTLPAVSNAQDYVILYSIQDAIPNVALWSIFAVIVLSAVMSTTDRLMLTIGGMFAWDIYKQVLKPDSSDKKVLLISKVVVILSALFTMLIAMSPPPMLAFLIWMGLGIMLSTFAVPLLGGLYWRGATRLGGIASMLTGLVSACIFGVYYQYIETMPMHFSFYAFVLSAVVLVVVSCFTKKTDEKILDDTETGFYLFSKKKTS